MGKSIEQQSINTIRTLAIDAIEKAQSGHPGLPMGAAPMGYILFTEFMKHNPKNAHWFNRDRFVLSAGHGSMLLYSLLHLSGYDVQLDDLKSFRQWQSRTPGHPEVHDTDGVEATTGPLGQGFGMAVGMAMAEAHLAGTFNENQFNMIDHYTYSLVGDGDVMEGISHEAASLAGHLGLGKLIVLYDSNDISLDGDLDRSFSDHTMNRFQAYDWQVIKVDDGNDLAAIRKALKDAKENTAQPTLIEVKTVIGYGAPTKSNSNAAHGAPLGEEEARQTKEYYNWTHEPFYVDDDVYDDFRTKVQETGESVEKEWNALFEQYEKSFPEKARELTRAINGELPPGWAESLPTFEEGTDKLATRKASSAMINAIAQIVPNLFGGSADLASSNNTLINDETDFTRENYAGRNIWFGVREFATGAAINGIALHGGLKVYGATFFVFSDYMRPAIRLSSIMNMPVTYVFTHDSIAVGEDGPTHEPVEQLASLRAMPGLSVLRPADGNETNAAWRIAMESANQPTALVLTRQGLPTIKGTQENALEGVKKGAYVISDAEENIDVVLLATGSEVHLAVEAQEVLREGNIDARVVSMPSWDRFEQQSELYQNDIIPKEVTKRVAIEMGSSLGWHKFTGLEGIILSVETYGASAPGGVVVDQYGFNVENVVKHVKAMFS